MEAHAPRRPTPSSPSERFEATIAASLGRLPASVAARLGGAPVEIDGLRLDPVARLLLGLERRSPRPSFETLPVPQAREEVEREARIAYGAPFDLPQVRETGIAGAAGRLPARLYVPEAAGASSPLVVYLHGGGWVVGSLDTHDSFCRFLARESGFRVLSVGYRLAPEDPFPAPLDDAVAAYRDAAGRAEELGADPDRIAIAGDSAGGNLAATASLRMARDGGATPAFQLLIYPVTDLSRKSRSYELFADGFYLTERQMDWYRDHYLAGGADRGDPEVSPLLAPGLSAAPPAHVVTAGFDVLRDEGEAYAERLRDAGVAVTHRREPGLVHAFINAVGISQVSREAVGRAAEQLRRALGTPAAC